MYRGDKMVGLWACGVGLRPFSGEVKIWPRDTANKTRWQMLLASVTSGSTQSPI